MATVTLTARYLDLLKAQRRRFEVFDTLVPGFAIRWNSHIRELSQVMGLTTVSA